MLSFWEQNTFLAYDYIVIGSGITGLNTACAIKEKEPKAQVLVLEKGALPSGASTKNAGFACIGSFTEKWADYQRLGESAFLKLIDDRWVGLYLLRKRLGDDNINFINYGGFELLLNNQLDIEDKINHLNNLLFKLFKKQVFYHAPQFIEKFGFNKTMVDTMLFNPFEGQIDTGQLMKTLMNYAGILQIRIINGINVVEIDTEGNRAKVVCKHDQQLITFTAKQVCLATNAFTSQFLPNEEIIPGRGQVICTAPIPGLKFTGIFQFDEGYYYFRNYGERIIFGGGRNLDFEGETTTSFDITDRIQHQLQFFLEEMIIPETPFQIEYRWSGIMAFNEQKTPLVKRINNHLVVGARLNGMGIALAAKIADEVSTLMLQAK
ncbi:MAG: FAD-binding oxidoreductase [Bacteroidia bacterium]|jgi:glycine/D-amino acid oxidase-like deaminating enzyme|nr:FAD-binding oxidoreductase [Bacteroidia bacterium]